MIKLDKIISLLLRLYKLVITSLTVLLLISGISFGKNLGQYGHVYEILEQNMLDFIHDRLLYLQETGELAKLESEAKARVKASILRPKPVRLGTTTDPKVFYYTPMYTLPQDVYDGKGNILYHKGTRFNSMDSSTYPEPLRQYHFVLPKWQGHFIFFNGDDMQQVNWLNKTLVEMNAKKQSYKLVMTGGNLKDTIAAVNTRVYFDQYGKLSDQFGIKHVPSMVSQENNQFKIQSFNVAHESLKLAVNHKVDERNEQADQVDQVDKNS
ncbi:type-F conjugative transfer system protein TraW [Fastidiosibacter lacustris]|uniref:type-F conjugative transfer system protein TraW n=1 Tax=Fastidiosibacter lacustris TaxID=2056695 RepID=UPI000E3474A2|nr:type-F conjugative transfer system protein TraW [Fastidiosibacter lacustris]